MENKITYNGEVVAEVSETDDPVFAENNKVILVGKILHEFEYCSNNFYRIKIRVGNGSLNCLWVLVPENLAVWKMNLYPRMKNMYVEIAGKFHATNSTNASIYANFFNLSKEKIEQEYLDCCYFRGEIIELFPGRTAELLLKVKSYNGKEDLVECIAYKNRAKYASKLKIGMNVEIVGEILHPVSAENEDGTKKIRNPKVLIRKMKKVC